MQLHNPYISWLEIEINKWLDYCFRHCLKYPCHIIASTTVESPNQHSQVSIPADYHEFLEVLSKQKAMSLLPHRPYDCAIDLLPGTTPTHNWVYSLSLTEQRAMEEYIQEVLHFHFPRLSQILFCGEKGRRTSSMHRLLGLKPDHNQVSVSTCLSLICSWTAPHDLNIYKGLCNAYNLVHIQPRDE